MHPAGTSSLGYAPHPDAAPCNPPPPGWRYAFPRASSLDDTLAQLTHLAAPGWNHRGEPCWRIHGLSSLGRSLRSVHAPLEAECTMIQYFRQMAFVRAESRDRQIMSTLLGVMIMMQHHGAPTRLLDWSRSPWIAAYFAASHDPDADGHIWSFDAEPLFQSDETRHARAAVERALATDDIAQYESALRESPACVIPLMSIEGTDRMLAQQCCFTFANPGDLDHKLALGRACSPRGGLITVIPREHKQALMRHLSLMNITASTLFPGLDGVGRSIVEAIEHRNDAIPRLLYAATSNFSPGNGRAH